MREEDADDPKLQGMSSTLTAILFGGGRYCLLNIGDSRTYLLRDGALEQLARDADSYVQLLIDQGHSRRRRRAATHSATSCSRRSPARR